ncbi:MAG: hypothetical protein LBE13_15480 [Bacteroidales bacterium]|jgi:hypothetical protein|nr:hypothetical protein [Bacteroidales bacterium]
MLELLHRNVDDMSYSPICLFTYRRFEHFKKSVKALQENYLSKYSDLYICSNAAIHNNEREIVNNIREFALSIKGFATVTLIKNEVNKGQEETFLKNITNILNVYKKIIVLEEDMVTTKNFLNYMNAALDYYENMKDVNSIAGYSVPIEDEYFDCNDVYFIQRSCSWGWATWLDRWLSMKWTITKEDLHRINWFKFNSSGYDKYNMLSEVVAQKLNAWDIKTDYTLHTNNLFTVYPKKSFLRNIGMDGSGEHCGKTNAFDPVLINENIINFRFNRALSINQKILKQFKKYYGNFFGFYLRYRFSGVLNIYRKIKYIIKGLLKI